MRLALVALIALATTRRLDAYKLPSVGSGELSKELQFFVDLYPVNKMVNLTKLYLARDKDFQLVIRMMYSDRMKAFVEDVEALREFKTLMNYMLNQGLNATVLLSQLKESMKLGLKRIEPTFDSKITGSLNGFAKDLSDLLPTEDIANLFEYKAVSSEVFKGFVNEILLTRYTDLFTSTFTNRHFLDIMKELEQLDVDAETFRANFPTLLAIQGFIRYYL